MKILILGGSAFIGRHIAETLLAAGHEVTTLNRGVSPDALPAQVERLRGDRDASDAGLGALGGRTWDACVDVSGYTPRQVRPSAERLRNQVRRYLYVSAVMAYGDAQERPVRETYPRLPALSEAVTEVNGETYGPLKATCERIVEEVYGERCTILRPQIVAGPHDPSRRYSYWVQRAMQGDEMLAPGDGTDHVQMIDVRDLARFARTAIEQGLGGSFNMAGPRLTWAAFLELLGARRFVWVPASILAEAGLSFMELPLYRPEHGPLSGLMDISVERALGAGLTLTDPGVTLRDVRAWLQGQPFEPNLAPEREAELIRRARQQGEASLS